MVLENIGFFTPFQWSLNGVILAGSVDVRTVSRPFVLNKICYYVS